MGGVKLTSRRDLVKPDPRVLVPAAVATFVTLAAVLLVLALTDDRDERMNRFGRATVAALAELSVEPLMRQDRLHLGVIANRLAAMPEITGVASYDADDRLLAATGQLDGPRYSAPVTIDENVLGYVRVALAPRAFAARNGPRLVSLIVVALLVPFAVAACWSLVLAAKRGELVALLPRWTWSRSQAVASHQDPDRQPAGVRGAEAAGGLVRAPGGEPGGMSPRDGLAEAADARQPDTLHYLLAVNLYNQLTLAPRQREFEQSRCADLAGRIADIYGGRVVSLPGVGTLVDFDQPEEPDGAFQMVCAAFLLSRRLDNEAPFGQYRLGLHVTTCPPGETPAMDDAAVADAALLSALGRNGTLAVSAPLAAVLAGDSRIALRPLTSPLLDELTTSGADCILVTALEASVAAQLAAQADQLDAERDATSSPSTF